LRIGLSLRGGGIVGVLPSLAAFGGADVEIRRAWWTARVGGAGSTTVSTPLGRGRADSQLLFARAQTCLVVPSRRVSTEGCAGVAGGVLFSEGFGYDEPRTADLVWVGAGLGLGAVVPLTDWLAVRVGIDGWAAPIRPRLQVHDRERRVRWQRTVPVAGLTADLGITTTFR
jgi:hypothetical protein